MFVLVIKFAMVTSVLQTARTQKRMRFYKMRELYLIGKYIGNSEFQKIEDCLEICFHMVNCSSFNAYLVGNTRKCVFLADNQCGFVRTTSGSTLFFQQKVCKFQLLVVDECVVAGSNSRSLTVDSDATCLTFQVNMDGGGFAALGKCIVLTVNDALEVSDISDERCQFGEIQFTKNSGGVRMVWISPTKKLCVIGERDGVSGVVSLFARPCTDNNYLFILIRTD